MNRNMTRISAALAVAATAGTLLAGCASGHAATGQAAPLPPASTPAASATPAGLGHAYTITSSDIYGNVLATFRLTLDKITEPAPPDPQYAMPGGSNLAAAPKGSHLAGVYFTATGLTGSLSDSAAIDYSAAGSDHHLYKPLIGEGAVAGDTGGFSVQAGQTLTGPVTFVVPDGVHLVSVTYNPFVGSGPVTWNLSR